jgi:hypothetical protein
MADRPVHPGDRVTFKTITVPPPTAVAEELSGKPESSSFQIHVKADEKARMCMLRKDHEYEDFTKFIQGTFGWQDFQAMFEGHPWEPGGSPPAKGNSVFVSPRMHGGSPPKVPVWPDEAIPLSHITNSAFEWTIHAKLSPEQIRTNDRLLDILEQVVKLERGPFLIGQTISKAQEIATCPFPNPTLQTLKGELQPNMTIRDVLRRLPISKWPPARPGQCFHPECKKSKHQMEKADHLQSHHRQRDYVTD